MMLLPIIQNLTAKQANTYGLVLASAGIFHQTRTEGTGWQIWVDESDEKEALFHIRQYEAENRKPLQDKVKSAAPKIQFTDSVIVALFLMAIHVAVSDNLNTFVERYGASASKIMAGEVYRNATALLLHADAVHLVGNMAGIILFGAVVCTVNGFGAGWLMILLTGLFGNYLNASLHQAHHMAIGASTAVFGAVGLLAAAQFWRKIQQPGERYKAWVPLGGGMALMAMLGTGAGRVDVTAHLFGFACGLGIQILYQTILRIRHMQELHYRHQVICLVMAMLILGLSCVWPVASLRQMMGLPVSYRDGGDHAATVHRVGRIKPNATLSG
ncbi:MAG: rhomboid family intramembrane serine protease [Smithellaceae bacterium]